MALELACSAPTSTAACMRPVINQLDAEFLLDGVDGVAVGLEGLLKHLVLDVGHEESRRDLLHALAFAGLSSQNPGVQQVAPALFMPDIKDEVLEKAFQTDGDTVDAIQKKFRV